MLSLAEVKELMGDKSLSEEEAEELRDACCCFAELLLNAWQNRRAQEPERADGRERAEDRLDLASAGGSLKSTCRGSSIHA